jgi:predicted transglutaminase-like cysteine proteinase
MRPILGAVVATLWLGTALPAGAFTGAPIFGTLEIGSGPLAALPQWRHVLDRIDGERPTYRACDADARACPSHGVMVWRALLEGLEGAPLDRQLHVLNHFINQWRYRSDRENYGRSDYWASPIEFMTRSGDCEDYAIAKYVSLRELGVGADRLRLVVVQDVLRDVAHAVLAVRAGDRVLILDNLSDAVLPDTRLSQYVPYYSVNENARWTHIAVAPLNVSSLERRVVPPAGPGR